MSHTVQERNKALVLEAFDTLFNKRDYAAAERYWSLDYIQHSAHIEPGREGLFNLIKGIPPVTVQVVTTGITPPLATSDRLQEAEKELLPHAEPLHTLR